MKSAIRRILRSFALWLLRLVADPPALYADPELEAVRIAFAEVGLPVEQFSPEFNLKRTGKIADVMHIAADRLGVDAEFDTVGDVVKWLKE